MYIKKKLEKEPEWFNLENYSGANSLTLREWFENLISRKFLLNYYTSMRSENLSEEPYFRHIVGQSSEKLINKILNDPIIRGQNTKLFFDHKLVSPLSISQLVRKYNSIKNKSNNNNKNELQSISYYLSSNSSEEASSVFEMIYSGTEAGKFLSEPCQDKISDCAYVSINLRATDEHILSGFKNWLAEIRVETGDEAVKNVLKKVFSQKDFNEWTKRQILPYLDLKLWEAYSGCHISNAVIGVAIFPEDYGEILIEDRIRKVTEKKVKQLINAKTLNAMYVQIRKEDDTPQFSDHILRL